MPRSFRPLATRSNGLSSSCQMRDVGVLDRAAGELLARAIFFERRGDEERLADFRDDDGDKPLAVAPADAGEVVERRAAGEDDRVDLLLGHQPPRLLEARAPLVGGDRLRRAAHRGQRGDARRQRAGGRVAAAAALRRQGVVAGTRPWRRSARETIVGTAWGSPSETEAKAGGQVGAAGVDGQSIVEGDRGVREGDADAEADVRPQPVAEVGAGIESEPRRSSGARLPRWRTSRCRRDRSASSSRR